MVALCVGGCKNANAYLTYTNGGFAFSTQYTLAVTDKFNVDTNRQKVVDLYEDITAYLAEVENSISVSIPSSSIYKFNESLAGESVEIDKTAYEVLSLAKQAYQFTQGYYNPAVYYSVDLYGFKSRAEGETMPYDERAENDLPKTEYITAFQNLCQTFENVLLEELNGKYYATKPQNAYVTVDEDTFNLKIDLGVICKGYATDNVNKMITDSGFNYGYFSFGQSSMFVNNFYNQKNQTSENYILQLNNPRQYITENGQTVDTGKAYLQVSASSTSVSTSGDYVQYYFVGEGENAKRICHIINPFTGQPINSQIVSATVVGGTAAEGDALSTALCIMDVQSAVDFINENLGGLKVSLAVETKEGLGVITNDPTAQILCNKYLLLNSVDQNGKIILN